MTRAATERRAGFHQQAENAGSLALAYAAEGDAQRAGDRARIAAYWAIRFRDPGHEHAPMARLVRSLPDPLAAPVEPLPMLGLRHPWERHPDSPETPMVERLEVNRRAATTPPMKEIQLAGGGIMGDACDAITRDEYASGRFDSGASSEV